MRIDLKDDTIRYVLRRRRKKELKKSTRDLEDHDISKGTVSNIEQAKGNIKPETIEIYLKKIGLTADEVIAQAEEVENKMKEVYYQLEAIEHIIDRGHPGTAKRQLERFQFEDYYPLTPFIHYLKGRICYEEKSWKEAEEKYHHALKLLKHYRFNPKDNIVAACYTELARCSFSQNNIEQALKFVEQGLKQFDETKEKKGIKYRLLGNKALYLLRTSRNDQASRLLDQVWPEVEKLDHSYEDYPVLNLYKFRSMILRDQGMYEEAIDCCHKGMQIARSRGSIRIGLYLDFLIIYGSINLKQKEFTKAYDSFQLALASDPDFRSPRRHVDAHTYLAVLFNSQKDWTQSMVHLEEAIKILQENPDPFRLAKTLIVKGNLFFLQKHYAEALPYFQEAAKISGKHGYQQREYTALLKSADCFDNLFDKEQFYYSLERMYRIQKELHIKSEAEIYEV
ncbi:tetratricopeptide repeat protein [Lihuaxuella thermophila]|uniref:Tetratricopeptide repeat-containing protein n=1 Tax=Lihuaxuella thermophila TaxID=1173111 RepID=A0A1H8BN23_9BACL|nr:tetratricopeptide repeat protein [Lihuaxuella thermophila]SEM84290.1 Tetratricopeptide repeat-containing protein [Lihuaxuella thermophila]